jgi:ABC-type multidrug transport system ATPase subunit
MTNVFSWQHIKYVVPVDHHEHRQLLDDVSGYVAPGVLTALMGESGAGKVRDFSLLLGLFCSHPPIGRPRFSMSLQNLLALVS